MRGILVVWCLYQNRKAMKTITSTWVLTLVSFVGLTQFYPYNPKYIWDPIKQDTVQVYCGSFEGIVTNCIMYLIQTGDVEPLSQLMRGDELLFNLWGTETFMMFTKDGQDYNLFLKYYKHSIDIQHQSLRLQQWPKEPYFKLITGGRGFMFTLHYEGTERYDDFLISTDGNCKNIYSISMHKDVKNNPYFQGNLNVFRGDPIE